MKKTNAEGITVTEKVNNLLRQMTLEEKIAQMGSAWIYDMQNQGELDWTKVQERLKTGIGQITRLGGGSARTPLQMARDANQLQKYLVEHTRLGIPAIIHEECCSGNMTLGSTAFPQMLGLASTFRPELAEKMTREICTQMRAVGVHQGLAPVLDVGRDPRWGRIEETFGEDPLLISQFGVRYIRGLQGPELKEGVMATGKHFVGHSLSQGGLNCAPVQMGKRTLWNVYLMPFQAAIQEAGIASMMNAYPELDEEVVAASKAILTGLLREQLGFNGLLVSDYEAVQMINSYHFVAPDVKSAGVMALNAGIDVELPTTKGYGNPLAEAIQQGQISLEQIDLAVSRHLQKKFELGLFDQPYVDEGRVLEVYETSSQRQLALEIAQQSLVLLHNPGILPFSKRLNTVAVIGPSAHDWRNLLGDYSYAAVVDLLSHQAPEGSGFDSISLVHLEANQVKVPTVLDAMRQELPDAELICATGCSLTSGNAVQRNHAVQAAQMADAVVLVLGDKAGLTPDCTCGETRDSADLLLPAAQMELARAVIATQKPVALVLINGRPLAIGELLQPNVAVLEAWLPGEEGGAAVVGALFGEFSPGGKLPVTFPRSVGQVPVFYNNKPAGFRSNWYNDYVTESVEPLFPFGHGLSYTQFEYSDLKISATQVQAGETVDISFSLKNSGTWAGEEVAQLYLHDMFASVPRPVKELKGFVRVRLEPGESKRVVFHLPVDLLAFYTLDLNLVVEPGSFEVMIGSSSKDIRLKAELEVAAPAPVMVEKRLFECPVEVM